jgi:hypothetical protein
LFKRCTNLTSFDIPNTVSEIGSAAFAYTGLTSISFPNSLTKLGKDAFSNCKITAVYIPKNITEINGNPFRNAGMSVSPYNDEISMYNDVSTIVVDEGNPIYDSRDNCNAIIHTASNTLLTGCKNTTIPNTVKTIGNNAFAYCDITSIDIPNSVVTIGDSAFYGCILLESLKFSNSLQKIGKEAFCANNSLKSLTTPASLKTIATGAFSQCRLLTDVDLSQSTHLNAISEYLFRYCSNLNTVKIPNSVYHIWHEAFSGTAWDAALPDGLNYLGSVAYKYKGVIPSNTHIDIVEGTKGIADDCFANCDSLTSVELPTSLLFIGEDAFAYCKNLASIDIPDNLTYIAREAFVHCENLTSAVIGKSVNTIGNHAFQYCTTLKQIKSKIADVNSVQVDNLVFYSVPTFTCVLKVPAGTAEAYRNKFPWSQFRNIEEWVDDVVGDVNADGAADGLDLNTIINIVLGNDDSNYDGRADMDGNGSVDGDDINQMINILLGK